MQCYCFITFEQFCNNCFYTRQSFNIYLTFYNKWDETCFDYLCCVGYKCAIIRYKWLVTGAVPSREQIFTISKGTF